MRPRSVACTRRLAARQMFEYRAKVPPAGGQPWNVPALEPRLAREQRRCQYRLVPQAQGAYSSRTPLRFYMRATRAFRPRAGGASLHAN